MSDKARFSLQRIGSLNYAGEVIRKENGETYHCDHGYAQYFVPQAPRSYPIVFWHGMGQSGVCFERAADGGEGYMQQFLADDWACYVVDQQRRGRAGRTLAPAPDLSRLPDVLYSEAAVWNNFRIGEWYPPNLPVAYDTTAFPLSPYAVEQFMRQQAPDTGEEPLDQEYQRGMGRAMGKLLDQTGPALLFTHSNSGQYGWLTAIHAGENIQGIVSYEPGGQYPFPEGMVPEIPSPCQAQIDAMMHFHVVSMEEFQKFTRFPILIMYGDFIAQEPSPEFNVDLWRVSLIRGQKFVELVNQMGGNAKLVRLPEVGIRGNGHAGFQDRNLTEIAKLVKSQLREYGLDHRDQPHTGPTPQEPDGYTIPL